jgi:hypothetical protein
MQCPICGNTITFPAIPPKTGVKNIAVEEVKPRAKWAWNPAAMFFYLRDFPHWKIVWQIFIPFLIIAGLLWGASIVKTKFSDDAPPPTQVYQPQPGGWDKMTALARADQKMQQCLQSLTQARAVERAATMQVAKAQQEMERARGSQEHDIANSHLRAAERMESQAQNTFTLLRQRFDVESLEYEKLGGTVDYRSQLPN